MPRPSWNDSVTDSSKYALSKEEILKKKRLYVSKHNVMSLSKRTTDRMRKRVIKTSSIKSTNITPAQMISNKFNDKIEFATSKDFDSENEEEDTTVLHLLQTPTKLFNRPPVTPGPEDTTVDLMRALTPDSKVPAAPVVVKNEYDSDNDNDSVSVAIVKNTPSSVVSKVALSKRKLCGMRGKVMEVETRTIKGTPRMMPPSRSSNQAKVQTKKKAMTIVDTTVNMSINSSYCNQSSTAAQEAIEMKEMNSEITALVSELRYYEQLTGQRSALDLDTTELELFTSQSTVSSRQQLMAVIRSLTQLVCKTMTYLLKSEVELQNQRGRETTLLTRMDALSALVMPNSKDMLSTLDERPELASSNNVANISATELPRTAPVSRSTASGLPPTPPVCRFIHPSPSVPKFTSRVNDIVLDGQVSAMRGSLVSSPSRSEQYLSSYYNSRNYGIVSKTERDDQLDDDRSVNISVSDGSVYAIAAPFNANLSPVRHGTQSKSTSNDVPAFQAQLTGSSTSDLLFANSPDISGFSGSLLESVAPALSRATKSAATVNQVIKVSTPVRGAPDMTRLGVLETENTSFDSGTRAYQEYLKKQNTQINDSSSESESESCSEAEREQCINPQAAFDYDVNDDELYWTERMKALDVLNAGVSELTHAVVTVKKAPVEHEMGPYSAKTRADRDENKENRAPISPQTPSTNSGSSESGSMVIPQVAPTPTQTPHHPFADLQNNASSYARVGVVDTPFKMDNSTQRGRVTERTFKF